MRTSTAPVSFRSRRRARAVALALGAVLALGAGGASAQAGGRAHAAPRAHAAVARPGVSFPSPGAMKFARLPQSVRGGHHFTMRGVMPLAIFGGVMQLQRQMPATGWRTVVSAAVRPKVFWLHWFVPTSWRGSTLTVRFVLESGGQLLAASPAYTMAVAR